ncbi:HEPN domain-containing protein [Fulvivirgaceae bacterium PWU5]|uniref:HEPN domain-containing protein n=1 Tax=Dawidia cretensis TaxID=2782350 RepID=A0AAP2GTB7_9BACT|nr:HEPN domain-containing protein [Dawidia cretensis]MBT1712034.1 HEPN domain-containing protein [Dawidia cretensis]
MATGDNVMVVHLREFSAVLDKIIEVVTPERVFCLGVRANRYEEWSMFKLVAPGVSYVTVDLVVVISDDDKRRVDEIEDIILKFNSETLQLNAIVHGDAYVRRAVERGSCFFSQVHRSGEMMYERAGAAKMFIPPWNHLNVSEVLLKTERYWGLWFGMGERSLSEAKNFMAKAHYGLAVCLLQKAAECTCVAVVRVGMGYTPPMTCGLRKLLELAGSMSLSMSIIFPGMTKEEEALLDTLHNALNHARTEEGYTVPEETARILADRVADLQGTALRVYAERMDEKVTVLATSEEGPDDIVYYGNLTMI